MEKSENSWVGHEGKEDIFLCMYGYEEVAMDLMVDIYHRMQKAIGAGGTPIQVVKYLTDVLRRLSTKNPTKGVIQHTDRRWVTLYCERFEIEVSYYFDQPNVKAVIRDLQDNIHEIYYAVKY